MTAQTTTADLTTTAVTYDCPECGFRARVDARARAEGRTVYPRRTCPTCGGTSKVTVDPAAILTAVTVSRGPEKGKLRKSRPALPQDKGGAYGAAFVWRLIRFNNGSDLTMPVMAYDYVGLVGLRNPADDAVRAHLDALIDHVGNVLCGKLEMMRGAAAWGRVLGLPEADRVHAVVSATVGMPMGNGYAVGDATDSPEAAVEAATDGDGNLDVEALAEMVGA